MIINKIAVGPLQTNCYLCADRDGGTGIIIDPGAEADVIMKAIEETGVNFVGIINTHGHTDHIGANDALNLPVMIHESDAPFLEDPSKNLSVMSPPIVRNRPASRLLKDGDLIEAGELTLRVIHTPGHSPGCICLLCEDVLFTGDTLFCQGVGRTDFPYSDTDSLWQSISSKLALLEPSLRILPGHGPGSVLGDEISSLLP